MRLVRINKTQTKAMANERKWGKRNVPVVNKLFDSPNKIYKK